MSLGGGGGGAPTSQTVTQTNLPEYAQPYVEDLMARAQAESYRDYTPYGGERLSDFSAAEQQAGGEILGMGTDPNFGIAQQTQITAGTGAQGAAGTAAGYGEQATGVGLGSLAFGAEGAGFGREASGAATRYANRAGNVGGQYASMATDPSQMAQYMSPYMQNVVDTQKAEAIRDAEKAQLGANLGAARRGTYGGARQLLAQTERERNLGSQLANIQAAGSQKAFEAAQQAQQFGSELGLRGIETGLRGTEAAGRLGIEGARTGQAGVRDALQGYRTGLEGTRTQLSGLDQLSQTGTRLSDISTAAQMADLRRLDAQLGIGGQQRGMEQQRLDMSYGDFLRQRDYPMEQLGYYSSLIRGMPLTMGSTQTSYAAPPSAFQQIGGAGLSALGLYNLGR